MAHATIFKQVGKTLEELTEYGEHNSPRFFGIDILEQPDGDPIIGIGYQCDFKAEEEWGISDLRKAFTTDNQRRFHMTKASKANVAVFTDVNGLVLSTSPVSETSPKWGHEFGYGRTGKPDYVGHFQIGTTDVTGYYGLHSYQVTELRQMAKEEGVKPLPTRKDDLIHAILAKRFEGVERSTWPGWFQSGRDLVLRADNGLTAVVLTAVAAAAKSGHLAIGNGGGVFGSGIFLYDSRDETKQLKKEREARFDWYDARMAELEPVAKKVSEDIGYYFLGRPSEHKDDNGNPVAKYWLNSHSTRKAHDGRQIFGWFSLAELDDGSYIDVHNSMKS